MAVTEVWMREEVVLEGYHQSVRHDRQDGRKGGGVLLFVKNSLPVLDCKEMCELSFEEAVWCLVRLTNSESVLLGLCYRSPNSGIRNDEYLVNMLRKTEQLHVKHVLVMGDFNYPQIDWNAGKVEGPEDSPQAQFYETTRSLLGTKY